MYGGFQFIQGNNNINPLLPSVAYMRRSAKIFILI